MHYFLLWRGVRGMQCNCASQMPADFFATRTLAMKFWTSAPLDALQPQDVESHLPRPRGIGARPAGIACIAPCAAT